MAPVITFVEDSYTHVFRVRFKVIVKSIYFTIDRKLIILLEILSSKHQYRL